MSNTLSVEDKFVAFNFEAPWEGEFFVDRPSAEKTAQERGWAAWANGNWTPAQAEKGTK